MKESTKEKWFFVSVMVISLIVSIALASVSLVMHKRSMEHVAGHPISWWDAFWTK